jgi:fucose permease
MKKIDFSKCKKILARRQIFFDVGATLGPIMIKLLIIRAHNFLVQYMRLI